MKNGKMTLDEAIRHAEDVSLECSMDSSGCSEEHQQLAEWLKELKKYKEYYGDLK